MITIDANAMLVGIMNPVYTQMCAEMALKETKGKVVKVGINGNPNDEIAINQHVQMFCKFQVNLRLV